MDYVTIPKFQDKAFFKPFFIIAAHLYQVDIPSSLQNDHINFIETSFKLVEGMIDIAR